MKGDGTANLSRWGRIGALWQARRIAGQQRARQGRLAGSRVKPAYQVFNDNRFEQHRNVWRSEID